MDVESEPRIGKFSSPDYSDRCWFSFSPEATIEDITPPQELVPRERQPAKDAAETLDTARFDIIEQWIQEVRAQLPAARNQSKLAIRNSLDEFFEALVDALRKPDWREEIPTNLEVARKHGQQRGSLKGYTLDQVLSEYAVLRRVILRVLRESSHLGDRETDIILEFIHEGMCQAGAEFVAVDERDRATALEAEKQYSRRIETEQAKLRAEKHKFESIFKNAPAALALFRGNDFVFENANPGYLDMFEGRDLIGKPLHDALPELIDQPFHRILQRVFETGIPYNGREELARLSRRDGAEPEDFYFDYTYTRIDDATGRPYGVYDHAIDVTEKVRFRKRLEESKLQLQEAVERLEAERELRERFVSTLSHDLRTPLTAAKMSAHLLARAGNDPAKIQHLSVRISENIDRADHMIRDLLDANLLQAEKRLPIDVGACDLGALLQTTLGELATVHGNRFVIHAAAGMNGIWDCSALRRVVENLASNAVKYGAPAAPVTFRLRKESDDQVSLSVHNEGNPISAEDLSTLFQPFQRTESAQRSRQKGWGLGLTLVQGLVEAHGGRAEVESAPEMGTIFRVILPRDARASH